MAHVRKRGLTPFAVYWIIVGILVLMFAAKLATDNTQQACTHLLLLDHLKWLVARDSATVRSDRHIAGGSSLRNRCFDIGV